MPNFGENKSTKTSLLSAIIQTGRPYTQSELNNEEHVRSETNTSCQTVPAAHMTRYKDVFHGIPLYVENQVTITPKMIDQSKQLACLLHGLAINVFKVPINTIHLFRDIDGGKHISNDHCST
jgi:hypothetical protein